MSRYLIMLLALTLSTSCSIPALISTNALTIRFSPEDVDAEQDFEKPADVIFSKVDLNIRDYKKLIIDPVIVPFGDAYDGQGQSEVRKMTDYIYETYLDELADDYVIVPAEGKDVLRVSITLEALVPTNTKRIEDQTIRPRRGGTTRPIPPELIGFTRLKTEITDSLSGETLMTFQTTRLSRDRASASQARSRWGAAVNDIAASAERIRAALRFYDRPVEDRQS